jgi:hypothetical protein
VQAKEAKHQEQVTNSGFLSECEAGEVSCSQTHKLGCGPYCKRDARREVKRAAEEQPYLNKPRLSRPGANRTQEVAGSSPASSIPRETKVRGQNPQRVHET